MANAAAQAAVLPKIPPELLDQLVRGPMMALLVATQHQLVFGRGQVQTDDVVQLLRKLGVTRHLEPLHPVRLQAERRPDTLDRGVASCINFEALH